MTCDSAGLLADLKENLRREMQKKTSAGAALKVTSNSNCVSVCVCVCVWGGVKHFSQLLFIIFKKVGGGRE